MKINKKISKWFSFSAYLALFLASVTAFVISIVGYKTWTFPCLFLFFSISSLISTYNEFKIQKYS